MAILDKITEMLRSKDSWSITDAARYDRLVTTFGESTGATSDVSGLRMPGSTAPSIFRAAGGPSTYDRVFIARSAPSPTTPKPATAPPTRKAPTVARTVTRTLDPDTLDLRRSNAGQERDAAFKAIERAKCSPERADALDELLRSEAPEARELARRAVVTERTAYRSAFEKYVRSAGRPNGIPIFFTDELARAANEGTSSQGGAGVPVTIDPTIIPSGGEIAPIAGAANVVSTGVSDVWKGVISAPPSFSWDSEGATVADDTPTLVQAVVNIFKADAYIPYTFELGQDSPGFVENFSRHLGIGFLDLLSQATAVGTGTGQPTGIFPALQAQTTSPSHVTVTTAGQISAVDVRKAYAAVPPRFRAAASWVMHETVLNTLRGLSGTADAAQVDLVTDRQGVTLMGRPVLLSDYCPSFTGTTGAANYLVCGDLNAGYTVAVRAGMQVELVLNARDVATGRPVAQRGLLAYARVGATATNPLALRLLSNS
jgi:HK97 family phage major capsid protein